METRPYFLFGDLLSNLLLGAVIGGASTLCVNGRWPMLAAMAAGMLAGMILSVVFGAVFSIFFGAFEIMVPLMLTGMLAGMAIPMWVCMRPLAPVEGAGAGAAIGLLALMATYALSDYLRGQKRPWTS